MNITMTHIPGVLIIEPNVFVDHRGFFLETFQAKRYQEHGIPEEFVQDNISRSSQGILRGLHFQREHAQGKLVYVTHGSALDVAVDVRRGSPTFGQSLAVELSDSNHRQVYIPPGLAHGFYAISPVVDFVYKCTDYYHPGVEVGIIWNDPDLNIPWPVSDPTMTERDKAYPRLKDIPVDYLPIFKL